MTHNSRLSRIAPLLAALALIFSLAPRESRTADMALAFAANTLSKHGVGGDAKSLTTFVTHGFPRSVNYGEMPQEPVEKCQLLILAMELLGKTGEDQAVNPLIEIARGSMSPGIQDMIQRDSTLIPTAERAQKIGDIQRFLQYNAAVALGYIGDRRAKPVVKELYDRETQATVKSQYALCLACLEDPSGLGFLFEEVQKANQNTSAVAAQAIQFVAGLDLGYRASSPVALRKKLAADYGEWWKKNVATFQLNSRAVLRRRLDPVPEARIAPNSTRNLVAMASNYADFADTLGSRTSGEKLDEMAKSDPKGLAGALEKVFFDTMEDMNVRREAIRRYMLLRGDDARKNIKKLTDDENPEISTYAAQAIQSLSDSDNKKPLPYKANAEVHEPRKVEKKPR